MGNYTELLENKLFTQWSDFEEDEDYERMIEFINSDSGFKTFGEGLIYIISKKYPDVDSENVIEFIYECCDKNEVKKESVEEKVTPTEGTEVKERELPAFISKIKEMQESKESEPSFIRATLKKRFSSKSLPEEYPDAVALLDNYII